jgi:hypothetical protein
MEQLFNLFVSQILNGGYVDPSGKFKRFNVRNETAAMELVPLDQIKSEFIVGAHQRIVDWRDAVTINSYENIYRLGTEILSFIPAISMYHLDDIDNVFRVQLEDQMAEFEADLI